MKAIKSSQPSLIYHKFLVNFFFYAVVAISAIAALFTLFMFFFVGFYKALDIDTVVKNVFGVVPALESFGAGGAAEVVASVGKIAAKLLSNFLKIMNGDAPRMHIRHFVLLAVSIAVGVMSLVTRNALAYFEKKAKTFLLAFSFIFFEFFAVIFWLYCVLIFKEVDYTLVLGFAGIMAAVAGLVALFNYFYYKKRSSLFEFNC